MEHTGEASPSGPRSRWPAIIIGCTVLGAFVLMIVPAVQSARRAAMRNSCNCHLKQITTALQTYHDANGSLPPAYIADAQGRPMHSWRILLLPYMEQGDKLKSYRFDEPWNSQHNLAWAKTVDSNVFRCPGSSASLETNYVAVVGDETAWPGGTAIHARDIIDGTSKTISVVEIADCGILWHEPRDLTVVQALQGVEPPLPGPRISSNHAGVVMVGFFDAHVSSLPGNIDTQSLNALLTRAGRDHVDRQFQW